jgi:hypothetical protein
MRRNGRDAPIPDLRALAHGAGRFDPQPRSKLDDLRAGLISREYETSAVRIAACLLSDPLSPQSLFP